MKRLVFSILTILIVFGGCAKRPASIAASYVSYEKYSDNTCTELATKMSDARAELAKISDMQNSKATGDAWGVFLIAVPVSQLTGDFEGDVAKWKGEVEAINTAQIKAKCK